METKKVFSSGKRKTAIARAILREGSGKIKIDKKNYETLHWLDKLRIEEPIRIAKEVLGKINFDADIFSKGGGEKSRIEASRLALARGILSWADSTDLEEAYIKYDRNLLVADIRRKEMRKPGDSKARKKRQTSYR